MDQPSAQENGRFQQNLASTQRRTDPYAVQTGSLAFVAGQPVAVKVGRALRLEISMARGALPAGLAAK